MCTQVHQQDQIEPDPLLEAGLPLPRALQREFPPELIATPIEDIDKYYKNKMVSMCSSSMFQACKGKRLILSIELN